MEKRQADKVFTRLPADAVNAILAMAPKIAKANGCTLLGQNTRMRYVPLNGRLQAVVENLNGEQISPLGKYGGTRVLFPAAINKMFIAPERVFRDGTDAPMTGQEKQCFYIEEIEGNAESMAAVAQLKGLYDFPTVSSTSWAGAVARCPDHKALLTLKTKKPTAEQITKHAQGLVDRGNVFFPAARDAEDENKLTLKFCNKIRQDRKRYTPATGTGFDIPIVDSYFESNPDCGLRLTTFLGRDGTEWMGKVEDLRSIPAGFVILTLYPDYYSDKIRKFTHPHNVPTVVCVSVETSSGSGVKFSMPNLQHIAGLPENESGDENDEAQTALVSAPDGEATVISSGSDTETDEDSGSSASKKQRCA